MGGGLIGASSWETLPWHPRLPQLLPHTWPARQTQACLCMGTIGPHSSAVAIPHQNGAEEPFLADPNITASCMGSQRELVMEGGGFVLSNGRIYAVSSP